MALNKQQALKALVKELEKNYLLQRACNKVGLTRSTVYRWMQEDEEFAASIRTAQAIGRRYMSDYVESKLLKNVDDKNQRAIEFWLKSNNEHYRSNDKALMRLVDSLQLQLNESQTALALIGKENPIMEFIDYEKARAYFDSPEWRESETLRKGLLSGNTAYEVEIIDQVKKLYKQIRLAELASQIGVLPEENTDLVG